MLRCTCLDNGKKIEPDWGQFNGVVGNVIEIAYKEGESPLDGSCPEYVIVDIPNYHGPPWMANKPSSVPIPPTEMKCQNIRKNRPYISRTKCWTQITQYHAL
jgi:hypothetical protein